MELRVNDIVITYGGYVGFVTDTGSYTTSVMFPYLPYNHIQDREEAYYREYSYDVESGNLWDGWRGHVFVDAGPEDFPLNISKVIGHWDWEEAQEVGPREGSTVDLYPIFSFKYLVNGRTPNYNSNVFCIIHNRDYNHYELWSEPKDVLMGYTKKILNVVRAATDPQNWRLCTILNHNSN